MRSIAKLILFFALVPVVFTETTMAAPPPPPTHPLDGMDKGPLVPGGMAPDFRKKEDYDDTQRVTRDHLVKHPDTFNADGETEGSTYMPVLPGKEENPVNLVSPMTHFSDNVFSDTVAKQYNSMTESAVALMNATWAMVEPAFFSAMTATAQSGFGASQNRYLADMQAKAEFAGNPESGATMSRAYSGCLARQMNENKLTYSESQEVCLGGRMVSNESVGGKNFNDDVMGQPDIMFSFKDHPSSIENSKIDPDTVDPNRPGGVVPGELRLTDILFNQEMQYFSDIGNMSEWDHLIKVRDKFVQVLGDVSFKIDTTSSGTGGSAAFKGTLQIVHKILEPTYDSPTFTEATDPTARAQQPTPFELYYRDQVYWAYNALLKSIWSQCVDDEEIDKNIEAHPDGAPGGGLVGNYSGAPYLYTKNRNKSTGSGEILRTLDPAEYLALTPFGAPTTAGDLKMFYLLSEADEGSRGKKNTCSLKYDWSSVDKSPNFEYLMKHRFEPGFITDRDRRHIDYAFMMGDQNILDLLAASANALSRLTSGTIETLARQAAVRLIEDKGMTLDEIATAYPHNVDLIKGFRAQLGEQVKKLRDARSSQAPDRTVGNKDTADRQL